MILELRDVLAIGSVVGGAVGTWVVLDRRLTIVTTKHELLADRVSAMEKLHAELAKDQGAISRDVAGLARDVNALTERVDDMCARVDGLSDKLDTGIGRVLAQLQELHGAVRGGAL